MLSPKTAVSCRYPRLLYHMMVRGFTIKEFARCMEMAPATLRDKLHARSRWKLEEMQRAREVLGCGGNLEKLFERVN